jgi:hypothetical protein
MKKRLIGAITLTVLLCIGFYYMIFVQQSKRPVSLALETANQSPAVASNLGGEHLRETYLTGHIISGSDYGNADLAIHVSSLKFRGTLLEWAQNSFTGWHICSLVLQPQMPGKEITIVSDGETHCDRE